MSATNQGIIGSALLTYAKGLISMAVAGLGVFSGFCLLVSIHQHLLRPLDISIIGFSIFFILFVYLGSRNDDPESPEYRYATFTLWIFYLIACTEAVVPVLRTYASESANYWSMPILLFIVSIRAVWDYFTLRIGNASP